MPPKKKNPRGMAKPLPPGQILTDLRKNQWRLGPLIGQGGFGYLYLGSDKVSSEVTSNASYVVKVEPHSNGPLFVELAFYQRAAKEETISAWVKSHKLSHLGVPRFIGSGSFENGGAKYRFMIMDRYGQDVEKIYLECSKKFPLQTVFSLGLRIIEALEYLHNQEYVHADIKASNLLTGFGNKNSHLVSLVDYGLAYRYCPSGQHVPYKEDPKRKHDGTIEYTSRDAHKGLAPSRRGDLEVLAYCMLQWISGALPWENKLTDCNCVMQEKTKFMKDVSGSLTKQLGSAGVPAQLEEYFRYVNKLEYAEEPDYDRVKNWFREALKSTGYPDDGKSVFFTKESPKKKRKSADIEGVEQNGGARKRKVAKSGHTSDEEENTSRVRGKCAAKSPMKKSAAKKVSPVKRLHRGQKEIKGSSPGIDSPSKRQSSRKTSTSPKKTKKSSPKRTKKTDLMVSTKSGIEGTRRRIRRDRNVTKVDFAQSP